MGATTLFLLLGKLGAAIGLLARGGRVYESAGYSYVPPASAFYSPESKESAFHSTSGPESASI